ncbi:hypothetical protein [Stenotrophomonas sp. SMYL86]|uniref:hypothetical protein n=1 Tax=Stenotrophomonas sp. SMYL86 TaxID=3076044 RepID=UPI002E773CE3|nr:hypothetical protein [Stenotrophomonas sp. SMYL86]
MFAQIRDQEDPSPNELEALRACTEEAKQLVEITWRLLTKLNYQQTIRSYTSLPLLLCALDRAWAFYELAASPRGYQGAATLFRPMVETFLRGAFLAGPAQDDEVLYFRKNDELKKRFPVRPTPDNRKKQLGAKELVEIVADSFGAELGERLRLAVQSDWDDWHGIVHGGRLVVAMYRGGPDENGQVGAAPMQQRPPVAGLINFIGHVACFVCLIPLAAGQVADHVADEETLGLVAAGRVANDAFFAKWGRTE